MIVIEVCLLPFHYSSLVMHTDQVAHSLIRIRSVSVGCIPIPHTAAAVFMTSRRNRFPIRGSRMRPTDTPISLY